MILPTLAEPIVQAPMAGGPSTPALAAAVARAGGLGFLAAGYKPVEAVRQDIASLREASAAPFGVNLFVPSVSPAGSGRIDAYLRELAAEAERYGVPLGAARHDDDGWEAKLDLLESERVALVSFTFGCPATAVLDRLRTAGIETWVTVTSPEEAAAAVGAGADGLVVQGLEAGGHRGSFVDAPGVEGTGLLALLSLVRQVTDVPLVASGGIMTGGAIAAVLCAGASAAQLGTALMGAPEAGTSPAHRAALAAGGHTALTRAFSGRLARGILNRFQREHSATAPTGYPEIHHATSPLRAEARRRGDADGFNLWAGQAFALSSDAPAEVTVRRLGTDARAALRRVSAEHAERAESRR